jgi:hypothetical protein
LHFLHQALKPDHIEGLALYDSILTDILQYQQLQERCEESSASSPQEEDISLSW